MRCYDLGFLKKIPFLVRRGVVSMGELNPEFQGSACTATLSYIPNLKKPLCHRLKVLFGCVCCCPFCF